MRKRLFADWKVALKINRDVVALWHNQDAVGSMKEQFKNATKGYYKNMRELPKDTAPTNVRLYFVLKEGYFYHYRDGYTDKKEFTKELDFVNSFLSG